MVGKYVFGMATSAFGLSLSNEPSLIVAANNGLDRSHNANIEQNALKWGLERTKQLQSGVDESVAGRDLYKKAAAMHAEAAKTAAQNRADTLENLSTEHSAILKSVDQKHLTTLADLDAEKENTIRNVNMDMQQKIATQRAQSTATSNALEATGRKHQQRKDAALKAASNFKATGDSWTIKSRDDFAKCADAVVDTHAAWKDVVTGEHSLLKCCIDQQQAAHESHHSAQALFNAAQTYTKPLSATESANVITAQRMSDTFGDGPTDAGVGAQ